MRNNDIYFFIVVFCLCGFTAFTISFFYTSVLLVDYLIPVYGKYGSYAIVSLVDSVVLFLVAFAIHRFGVTTND